MKVGFLAEYRFVIRVVAGLLFATLEEDHSANFGVGMAAFSVERVATSLILQAMRERRNHLLPVPQVQRHGNDESVEALGEGGSAASLAKDFGGQVTVCSPLVVERWHCVPCVIADFRFLCLGRRSRKSHGCRKSSAAEERFGSDARRERLKEENDGNDETMRNSCADVEKGRRGSRSHCHEETISNIMKK